MKSMCNASKLKLVYYFSDVFGMLVSGRFLIASLKRKIIFAFSFYIVQTQKKII